MSLQRTFKFTTAIMFAVLGVILLHFMVWLLAIYKAETGLRARLDALATQGLTYGGISHGGYPGRISLVVDDVAIRWTDPQSPDRLTYRIGQLVFETTLTGDLHIELNLPTTQQLDVVSSGRSTSYDILIEGGQIATYENDGTLELSLNASALSIYERQSGVRRPLLKTGDLFFTRRAAAGVAAPLDWDWRLSVNKVQMPKTTTSWDNLLIDLGMKGYPESRFHELVLLLLGSNQRERTAFVNDMLAEIAARRAKVTVSNVRVKSDDFWATMRGELGLDNQRRLQGNTSLSTNDMQRVIQSLGNSQIVRPEVLDDSQLLARALQPEGKETSSHVNLQCNQGVVSFNGVGVGTMPKVLKLLGISE